MKKLKMNVAVISPVFDSYPVLWVQSIFSLINSKIANFSFISPVGNSNITNARNACLQQVLLNEDKLNLIYDYLFFIDCDIIFNLDNVKKIFSHNKDIVSGLYFEKGKARPVAGFFDLNPDILIHGLPRISKNLIEKKEDLVSVDWVGMGFVLIKRHVIDELSYPWFEMTKIEFGFEAYKTGKIKIDRELLSEDISFWRKVKSKIYVDPTIKLGHIGNYIYSYKDFNEIN